VFKQYITDSPEALSDSLIASDVAKSQVERCSFNVNLLQPIRFMLAYRIWRKQKKNTN